MHGLETFWQFRVIFGDSGQWAYLRDIVDDGMEAADAGDGFGNPPLPVPEEDISSLFF